MRDKARCMLAIGLLGGLLAGPADASLTYNLSLSGDVTGSGKLVLKDGALASDGIFDLGPQLVSFELSVPSLSLVFTSLFTADTGVEYKVAGGALAGADLLQQEQQIGGVFWTLDFGNFADNAVVDWGDPKSPILKAFFASPVPGCSVVGLDVACAGTISAAAAPPVPIPAAAWLLLSGLAGLGAMGRRKA